MPDCGGGGEFPCFLLLFMQLHFPTEIGIDVRSQLCSIRLGRRVYRYSVYLRESGHKVALFRFVLLLVVVVFCI